MQPLRSSLPLFAVLAALVAPRSGAAQAFVPERTGAKPPMTAMTATAVDTTRKAKPTKRPAAPANLGFASPASLDSLYRKRVADSVAAALATMTPVAAPVMPQVPLAVPAGTVSAPSPARVRAAQRAAAERAAVARADSALGRQLALQQLAEQKADSVRSARTQRLAARADTFRTMASTRDTARKTAAKTDKGSSKADKGEKTTEKMEPWTPDAVGARWITPRGKPEIVSVSFYDEELRDILTLFSEISGLSILTSDETAVIQKKITADVKKQPWHVALEVILRSAGLSSVQDSSTGVILVQSEARSLALRTPEIVRLRYTYSDDIVDILQPILTGSTAALGPGGTANGDYIKVVKNGEDSKSRSFLVYTSPEKMAKIRAVVRKVDRKRPTVTIQAKMVFVNRSKLQRLGFNYQIVSNALNGTGTSTNTGTGTTGGSTANTGAVVTPINNQNGSAGSSSDNAFKVLKQFSLGGQTNMNVFVDALISNGLAEVETSPLVTVLSDLSTSINVGEFFILPSPPQFIGNGVGGQQTGGGSQQGTNNATSTGGAQNGVSNQFIAPGAGGFNSFQTGTTLKVTPYVLEGGRVRMQIDLSRDGGTLGSDGRTITGGRQSTTTEVIVRDNESMIIGGLAVTSKTTTRTGVPVLKNLPLIGGLFQNNSTAELFQDLVVLITPKIIYDPDDDIQQENALDDR